MTDPEVDQKLVERVQAGDKQAFDMLVQKYQHKLIKMIGRYVSDPSEAQDVAQEAFIKAYRALPRFRGDSSFYTWIYRIGANTAKNYLVAQGRRPPGNDVDAQDAEQYVQDSLLRERDTRMKTMYLAKRSHSNRFAICSMMTEWHLSSLTAISSNQTRLLMRSEPSVATTSFLNAILRVLSSPFGRSATLRRRARPRPRDTAFYVPRAEAASLSGGRCHIL